MPHGFDITTTADANYNTAQFCSVFLSCFVWGFGVCKCTPQGQPCLSQLSFSSVVSAALSSRATNPQRVTLSTHPHHYPHIFLFGVERSIWNTSSTLMLFVHQSSLKPTSQFTKYISSLSLSSELQWEKAVAVLSFCAEKWLMRDIHSAFVKPVKYPTPHLLDLNGRLPAPRSFIPTFEKLPRSPVHIFKAYINVGRQRAPICDGTFKVANKILVGPI